MAEGGVDGARRLVVRAVAARRALEVIEGGAGAREAPRGALAPDGLDPGVLLAVDEREAQVPLPRERLERVGELEPRPPAEEDAREGVGPDGVRRGVADLRRERLVFDQIYKKLEKELAEEKAKIAELTLKLEERSEEGEAGAGGQAEALAAKRKAPEAPELAVDVAAGRSRERCGARPRGRSGIWPC